MKKGLQTRHRNYRKTVIVNLLMCGTLLSGVATTATTVFAAEGDQITATSGTERAQSIKTGMSITANSSSVYAGENAAFQFRFHNALTNNSGVIKAPTLKLALTGVPKSVLDSLDLNSLKIMGVTPTLSLTTLVYQFDDLKAGADINVALAIPTLNGITPSDTKYSIAAELASPSLSAPIQSTSTPVAVVSQSAFAVSNAFVNTVNSAVQVAAPRIGDETSWKFNVGLPKLSSGSKFLKEGSQITVTYRITGSAVYSDVLAGTPEPTTISADKQLLTWVFDAPTTAEQASALTDLFSKDFNVQIKINDDAIAFTKVATEASVTGEFIDGLSQSESHKSEVTITQLEATDPPEGAGELHTGFFYGPKNGAGEESSTLSDQNPTVNPDAELRWRLRNGVGYQLSKWDAEGARPKEMEITFNMDGHQNLTKFWSASALSWFAKETPTTLTRQPKFDLIVEYEDGQTETLIENVQPDLMYSFTSGQYKLTKSVKKLTFKYSYIPPMNYNPGIYLYTTPKAGFTGQTTITPEIRINGNGNQLGQNGTLESKYDATGIHSFIPGINGSPDVPVTSATQEGSDVKGYMGYRSVNVVDYTKAEKRVYSQDISVNTDNKVKLGTNNIALTVTNLKQSQAAIEGTLSSYVLLPVGVSYSDTNADIEQITDNYNNTNRTLLKVSYGAERISVDKKLQIAFEVTANKSILTTGKFDLLTFIDTDADIYLPDTTTNPFDLMPSKDSDINDLNGNGDTSEPIYVSSRSVDFVDNHGLSISADSGFVGADQQGLLKAKQGGKVSYQLKLGSDTDKTLENVKVMGVLPSTSDYGLVTLLNRESQFGLTLTGPITIKNDAADFTIYYSTSDNIKTVGELDVDTAYPADTDILQDHAGATTATWIEAGAVTDWSKIKSFKIVQNAGTIINSSELEVNIPLSMPKTLATSLLDASVSAADRSAYLNVAVAADNYLPVENLKTGVYANKVVEKAVNYLDTAGNIIAKTKTISGSIGDSYDVSTAEYNLTISGYTFKEVKGITKGIFADNEPSVDYIYTKNPVKAANLVVNYLDADGKQIAKSKTITGNIGDRYNVATAAYKLAISGYTFKEVKGITIGVLSDKAQTVSYIYEKLGTKPIDKDQNKLPQTGEKESLTVSLVGLALLVLTIGRFIFKPKED